MNNYCPGCGCESKHKKYIIVYAIDAAWSYQNTRNIYDYDRSSFPNQGEPCLNYDLNLFQESLNIHSLILGSYAPGYLGTIVVPLNRTEDYEGFDSVFNNPDGDLKWQDYLQSYQTLLQEIEVFRQLDPEKNIVLDPIDAKFEYSPQYLFNFETSQWDKVTEGGCRPNFSSQLIQAIQQLNPEQDFNHLIYFHSPKFSESIYDLGNSFEQTSEFLPTYVDLMREFELPDVVQRFGKEFDLFSTQFTEVRDREDGRPGFFCADPPLVGVPDSESNIVPFEENIPFQLCYSGLNKYFGVGPFGLPEFDWNSGSFPNPNFGDVADLSLPGVNFDNHFIKAFFNWEYDSGSSIFATPVGPFSGFTGAESCPPRTPPQDTFFPDFDQAWGAWPSRIIVPFPENSSLVSNPGSHYFYNFIPYSLSDYYQNYSVTDTGASSCWGIPPDLVATNFRRDMHFWLFIINNIIFKMSAPYQSENAVENNLCELWCRYRWTTEIGHIHAMFGGIPPQTVVKDKDKLLFYTERTSPDSDLYPYPAGSGYSRLDDGWIFDEYIINSQKKRNLHYETEQFRSFIKNHPLFGQDNLLLEDPSWTFDWSGPPEFCPCWIYYPINTFWKWKDRFD